MKKMTLKLLSMILVIAFAFGVMSVPIFATDGASEEEEYHNPLGDIMSVILVVSFAVLSVIAVVELIFEYLFLEHLDGDRAVHQHVMRFKDDRHTADADDLIDLITAVKHLTDVFFKLLHAHALSSLSSLFLFISGRIKTTVMLSAPP